MKAGGLEALKSDSTHHLEMPVPSRGEGANKNE
jgi:hypothetical protein